MTQNHGGAFGLATERWGVVGVLLAAGAGRRAGGPKALRHDPDGTPWLVRSIAVLQEGGCDAVVVVLGAEADQARRLLRGAGVDADPRVRVVEEADWARGLATSLRAGIRAAAPADAMLVHLVDLPDVTAAVVRRVLGAATAGPQVLARASYDGAPGHPVLIGADHLDAVLAEATADRGASAYLRRHHVLAVPCEDLASGQDRDGVTDGMVVTEGAGVNDA